MSPYQNTSVSRIIWQTLEIMYGILIVWIFITQYFMRNLKNILIAVVVLTVVGGFWLFTTQAAGRTYLQYCSGTISNLRCNAGYQDDIDAATSKAKLFEQQIRIFSDREQWEILDELTRRLALYHASTNNQYEKVIASFYYDYFKVIRDGGTTVSTVDSILRELIGTSSINHTSNRTVWVTQSIYTNNTPDDGKITAISAWSSSTSIRNNRITARWELNLEIVAKERNTILQDDDVRIVAELYDGNRKVDTVAANEVGAYWSLILSDQFDRVDEIRIFLLCQECDRGSRFQWNLFNNWRVLDNEKYDVSLSRTYNNNYNNRYYNDRYYDNNNSNDEDDLQLRSLEYEYDGNGRDVDIELEVMVRNIGERDNILESLSYDVEIDGRRISSNRYDIDHKSTRCDDRNANRNDDRNITIDEWDECTIIVEITFDQDDVEDEYVEIEVSVNARRDDDSSNNDKSVRFRVD